MQLRMDQLEQAIDPAYRFLAFYGEALNQSESKPTFHELELDLKDGTWIGWGSMEGIIQPETHAESLLQPPQGHPE